ncbi:MAG TPA: 4Fe-4S binding protein [Anaerolineales bacterium]|nr:4Fe-4S binding protein [Anaerolineales bacterium]
MSWKAWRRVRQAVQIIFFAFYIALIFAVVQKRIAPALSDIFFRFDPLSALGAMLASRLWIPKLGLALITVGVTLFIGRVWCGWICPLGSLLEWISFAKARKRAASISPRWRLLKYFLLVTTLVAALFGSLTLLALDPLAIFTRTLSTTILPGLFYAINSVETALYHVHSLNPALDSFEEVVRGNVLPVEQPAFAQSLAIGVFFFGIIALNLFAHRFWCRYLCPLGALLGWLSKISVFRPVIGNACTECTRCAITCKPGAIDTTPGNFAIMPAECTLCLDCLGNCKPADIRFKLVLRPAPKQDFELSRRQALGALVSGTAGVVLLGTELRLRQDNPSRIRPPGVVDENSFLSTCLRCSQCMKICPTTALQPALNETGLAGLWTPIVVPRVGYCDYGCTACGQVCPSGAIPLLELNEKRMAVIGKASIDRNRCLPWASGVPCIVCEEMCPTPQKSIRLEEAQVTDANGQESIVQRPSVLREVCIGCGICEHQCPLEGVAAIRIYNA